MRWKEYSWRSGVLLIGAVYALGPPLARSLSQEFLDNGPQERELRRRAFTLSLQQRMDERRAPFGDLVEWLRAQPRHWQHLVILGDPNRDDADRCALLIALAYPTPPMITTIAADMSAFLSRAKGAHGLLVVDLHPELGRSLDRFLTPVMDGPGWRLLRSEP